MKRGAPVTAVAATLAAGGGTTITTSSFGLLDLGGDGPAFVQGPIRVVSLDIYGLDGDGNGIGCEPAPPKSSTPKDEVVIVIPPPAASVAATAVSGSPRFTG